MSETPEHARVDVWLWRARFAKTRAAAAAMVEEGGVRLIHNRLARRIEKGAALLAVGDALVFTHGKGLRGIEVLAFGVRRGPPAEARLLYRELEAPGG